MLESFLRFARAHRGLMVQAAVLLVLVTLVAWLAARFDEQTHRLADAQSEAQRVEIAQLQTRLAMLEREAAASTAQAKAAEEQSRRLAQVGDELAAQAQKLRTAGLERLKSLTALPLPEVRATLARELPAASETAASYTLDEKGMRAAASLIATRDNCVEQLTLAGERVENCEQHGQTLAAQIASLNAAVGSYQAALKTQQDLTGRERERCEAELKRARGTWFDRLKRNAKWMLVGGGIAVALVEAAR
jgi:hypothetical protein